MAASERLWRCTKLHRALVRICTIGIAIDGGALKYPELV